MPAAPTSIMRHFAALSDPRAERGKDHLLLDILTIALCAASAAQDNRNAEPKIATPAPMDSISGSPPPR